MKKLLLIFILCFINISCISSGRLNPNFPENNPSQLNLIIDKLNQNTLPVETKKYIAIITEDSKLIMYRFDNDQFNIEKLWEAQGNFNSIPLVIGSGVVVIQSNDNNLEVVQYPLEASKTATPMWRFSLDSTLDFMGMDFDNDMIFIVLSTSGPVASNFRDGRIIALKNDGSKQWEIEANAQLGKPVASSGMVFIPGDRMFISILSGNDGQELAKIRSTDDLISYIFKTRDQNREEIYYGGVNLYKLTLNSASGKKSSSDIYLSNLPKLPGEPNFAPDSYTPENFKLAYNKIRLIPSFNKNCNSGVCLNDISYLFYRSVLSFQPQNGSIIKADFLPEDIARITHDKCNYFGVTQKGTVIEVSNKLEVTKEKNLGISIAAAGFSQSLSNDYCDEQYSPVPEQIIPSLLKVIFSTDNRMLNLRKLAVVLMGSFQDSESSKQLLDIISNTSVPQPLKEIGKIILRSNPPEPKVLLNKLDIHYNYLNKTDRPPSGTIATIFGDKIDNDTLEELLSHLEDHETSVDELPEISRAIFEHGSKNIVQRVAKFIKTYHSDSDFTNDFQTLSYLSMFLAKMGTNKEKEFLKNITSDPFTHTYLTDKIKAILKIEPSKIIIDETSPVDETKILTLIKKKRADLIPCMEGAKNRNNQQQEVKLNITVTPEGKIFSIKTEPYDSTLLGCITIPLDEVRFPQNQKGFNYILKLKMSLSEQQIMIQR